MTRGKSEPDDPWKYAQDVINSARWERPDGSMQRAVIEWVDVKPQDVMAKGPAPRIVEGIQRAQQAH